MQATKPENTDMQWVRDFIDAASLTLKEEEKNKFIRLSKQENIRDLLREIFKKPKANTKKFRYFFSHFDLVEIRDFFFQKIYLKNSSLLWIQFVIFFRQMNDIPEDIQKACFARALLEEKYTLFIRNPDCLAQKNKLFFTSTKTFKI